jgi:flavin reductase (DIM6/NTAB) family NADH-FMN oxidoreductase RutF
MDGIHCDPQLFRKACSRFPTGVTVTTVLGRDGKPYGTTVSSFTSVSLNPPMVLVCIDQRSQMLSHLEVDRCFAVNILGDCQKELSVRFSESRSDRFANVRWHAGVTGAPVLFDVPAIFECRIASMTPAGDHVVVIGRVAHVMATDRPPLAYLNSSYGKIVGKESVQQGER